MTNTPAHSAKAPPGNDSNALDRDRRSIADSKRATKGNRRDDGNSRQMKRTGLG